MKKLIFFITHIFIFFYLYSCENNPSIIPPQADQGFGLNVDIMSIAGKLIQIQDISFTPEGVPKLNSSYTTKISKLDSYTEYYLTLQFSGTFTTGGETQVETLNIGTTKTFTTD